MGTRDIAAALRSGWWLVVVGLVLGGLLAGMASLLATPLYLARTQLFVSAADSGTVSQAVQGSQFSRERVTSYAQLLAGEELAARVVDRLDLEMSPRELTGGVIARVVPDTVLIDVTVTDPSPARAREIANALASEFTEFVDELEAPSDGSATPVRVRVTDRAERPTSPATPQTERNIALGLVVGGLLGGAASVARVRLDRSTKDPAEVAELGRAPVIGTVIRDENLNRRHVIDRQSPTRVIEDYRQLRTNLQFLNVDDPPKVIMLSSSMPAEGKTTAAINLALALAEAGRQVTIVDADLRRPRITNYLGMVGGVGLTNILAGTADLGDVLQTYGDTGVQVIGAGPTPPNPSELLASKHMLTLIDELRGKSDYVLIDAPPLLPVADSTGLAVMVDGVLLSVRYGKSRKDQLQQAATTLERVGARTLGLILNIVPQKAGITAAYGYGYTYGDDDQVRAKKHRP